MPLPSPDTRKEIFEVSSASHLDLNVDVLTTREL